MPRDGVGITWSREPVHSKWNGIVEAISRSLFSLDDYDYVATPDDDLILTSGDMSRAFALARKHQLASCQLSLYHDSFFGYPWTLRQPHFELHYVSRVELMAPIIRIDVFKRMLAYMTDPDSLWGMDHVVGAFAGKRPRATAVLDQVSVLHTRTFWKSSMYEKERERTQMSPIEVERRFLVRHGLAYIEPLVEGGLALDGSEVGAEDVVKGPSIFRARMLRRLRSYRPELSRIAGVRNGQVVVMRPMVGASHVPVDYEAATGLRRGWGFRETPLAGPKD
jgi:hypothetical protein